jgi:hypothetical protein
VPVATPPAPARPGRCAPRQPSPTSSSPSSPYVEFHVKLRKRGGNESPCQVPQVSSRMRLPPHASGEGAFPAQIRQTSSRPVARRAAQHVAVGAGAGEPPVQPLRARLRGRIQRQRPPRACAQAAPAVSAAPRERTSRRKRESPAACAAPQAPTRHVLPRRANASLAATPPAAAQAASGDAARAGACLACRVLEGGTSSPCASPPHHGTLPDTGHTETGRFP